MFREMLILLALNKGPNHGYGIRQMYPGVSINNKTLYNVLSRLETDGYVTCEMILQEKKAAKKIYTLKPEGRIYLKELLAHFTEAEASDWLEFQFRISSYDLLGKEDLKNILDLRENYLRTTGGYVKQNIENAAQDPIYSLNAAHICSRVENELAYISDLRCALGIRSA